MDAGLLARSGGACELCGSAEVLEVYDVPSTVKRTDSEIGVCGKCLAQLMGTTPLDANHWQCLNGSMWSTVPAVQVVAWRMLNVLIGERWSQDLLDIFFLDENLLAWAKEAPVSVKTAMTDEVVVHKDSNGNKLSQGDTIVLIKDLDVKGGGFTAKRGTAVRNISLVENNANQIEGRINGQQIVILTQYTKKSS